MICDFFDIVSTSLILAEDLLDKNKSWKEVIATDKYRGTDVEKFFTNPMFDEEAMKKWIFCFKSGLAACALGIEAIDFSWASSALVKRNDMYWWKRKLRFC